VAAQLKEPADVKAATTALRARLEQERDDQLASGLARVYAEVAARLKEPADVKAAAMALRARLEQAQGRKYLVADTLAQAYATVASVLVRHTSVQGCPMCAAEILMLAGHPFVDEPKHLLAALEPVATTDFGNDLGAAVEWATKTYGLKPEQLRPQTPLSGSSP
jgi:hypothetical protein